MTPRERFSNRRGFRPAASEIVVREDAPPELREAVIQIARDHEIYPSQQRSILCRMLRVMPDQNNWSEYPNVWSEVEGLIGTCPWYSVYDYIEALYQYLAEGAESERAGVFAEDINQFFLENGIGWQLRGGEIEVRGPEAFEAALRSAAQATETAFQVVNREVQEALHDLSRRPDPDLTGAIQHAIAALECVAREATGDGKATLGAILAKNPGLMPKPLDAAAEKLWGFASESARHLREGQELVHADVELTVGIAAQLVTYLARPRVN